MGQQVKLQEEIRSSEHTALGWNTTYLSLPHGQEMEDCSATSEDPFGTDRGNWKDDKGSPSCGDAGVVSRSWLAGKYRAE